MTGTQRMTELAGQTVVRLTTGLSKTSIMKFAWGIPNEPVTLGLRGSWGILAEGMLDVHLHLGFDGKQLLLALPSPHANVLMNGQRVSRQGWLQVPVPGRVEFGGATLEVAYERPDGELGVDPDLDPLSQIDTMFDGGVLRARARGMSGPPPANQPAQPPAEVAKTMASATPGFAQAPAAAKPEPAGRDERSRKDLANASGTPAPRVASEAAQRQPSDLPANQLSDSPAPKPGFWASASVPKKLSVALLPLAVLATLYSMEEPDAEIPAPVAATARPLASAPTASSAVPSTNTNTNTSTTTTVPRLARTPASPTSANAGAVTPGGATPETISVSPSGATTAAATAPQASAAAPTSPAVTAPVPSVEHALAASAGVSPRAALDAAFLGNFKDASRAYAKLAAANPDNKAFQLASQLTASEAVRRP